MWLLQNPVGKEILHEGRSGTMIHQQWSTSQSGRTTKPWKTKSFFSMLGEGLHTFLLLERCEQPGNPFGRHHLHEFFVLYEKKSYFTKKFILYDFHTLPRNSYFIEIFILYWKFHTLPKNSYSRWTGAMIFCLNRHQWREVFWKELYQVVHKERKCSCRILATNIWHKLWHFFCRIISILPSELWGQISLIYIWLSQVVYIQQSPWRKLEEFSHK